MKIRIFHISNVFSNSIRFKSNLENGEILSETYFCDFLQMVCRIDANDMVLESCGKCPTFLDRNIFLIPYRLNLNLNIVKFNFERDFFKKFVEMVQIIYRWKDIENAKLSHVEYFL